MALFTRSYLSWHNMCHHIRTQRLISSLSSVRASSETRRLFHHPLFALTRTGSLPLGHYTESAAHFVTAQRLYAAQDNENAEEPKKQKLAEVTPRIGMFYKCKICDTRNNHTFSKKAYQEGVVIVQCVHCKSNHLVADNLGWFKDVDKRNIEEIMAAKGEEVKRITDLDLPKDLLDQIKVGQTSQE